MPLRDHFRPPLDKILSWEELHGQWPAVIVQQLRKRLPPGYAVGPRVHSGSQIEIDVAAFEKGEPPAPSEVSVTVAVPLRAPTLELPALTDSELLSVEPAPSRLTVPLLVVTPPLVPPKPASRDSE